MIAIDSVQPDGDKRASGHVGARAVHSAGVAWPRLPSHLDKLDEVLRAVATAPGAVGGGAPVLPAVALALAVIAAIGLAVIRRVRLNAPLG